MEKLVEYIDYTVEKLQQEELALIASHRKDEANLVKVKINVYGIAKTLADVAGKIAGDEEVKEVFQQKVDGLSRNWKLQYEEAVAHEDVEKIVVEEAKRQAIDDVLARLKGL